MGHGDVRVVRELELADQGPGGVPDPLRSQEQAEAPATTWTKTTGESGRKVPVPESRIGNGRPAVAIVSRCASIAGRSAASASVGGSRVTWVGMP